MLPVASLLNPVTSESRIIRHSSSKCFSQYMAPSSLEKTARKSQSLVKKQKMVKDGAIFTKGKAKGDINFPPFEDLCESAAAEVQKFQVYPLGRIREYSRHIPYNSERKSFLEKTGRESFEVFQYVFKLPGEEKEYTVMWDYNIGLVRITPFFKCCKYSKTTPAKMLNMNLGLKEITHSITGGALAAQGYWMPYSCALSVCATFCHQIAGALIPIFGPEFPASCIIPGTPEYGRMVIDPNVISAATREAETFKQEYGGVEPALGCEKSDNRDSPRARISQSQSSTNTPTLGRRLRLKRAFGALDSPYGTDTEVDTTSETSSSDRYLCSPLTPSSHTSMPAFGGTKWATTSSPRSVSRYTHCVSPSMSSLQSSSTWLSAIPRSILGAPVESWADKQPVEFFDNNSNVGGGEENAKFSRSSDKKSAAVEKAELSGMEKKAAWLLMHLSVKDSESNTITTESVPSTLGNLGPQIKRRRATSM